MTWFSCLHFDPKVHLLLCNNRVVYFVNLIHNKTLIAFLFVCVCVKFICADLWAFRTGTHMHTSLWNMCNFSLRSKIISGFVSNAAKFKYSFLQKCFNLFIQEENKIKFRLALSVALSQLICLFWFNFESRRFPNEIISMVFSRRLKNYEKHVCGRVGNVCV